MKILNCDTNDDRMDDKQEPDAGTNPFKSDDDKALEFTLGFATGEIFYDAYDSLYYPYYHDKILIEENTLFCHIQRRSF